MKNKLFFGLVFTIIIIFFFFIINLFVSDFKDKNKFKAYKCQIYSNDSLILPEINDNLAIVSLKIEIQITPNNQNNPKNNYYQTLNEYVIVIPSGTYAEIEGEKYFLSVKKKNEKQNIRKFYTVSEHNIGYIKELQNGKTYNIFNNNLKLIDTFLLFIDQNNLYFDYFLKQNLKILQNPSLYFDTLDYYFEEITIKSSYLKNGDFATIYAEKEGDTLFLAY